VFVAKDMVFKEGCQRRDTIIGPMNGSARNTTTQSSKSQVSSINSDFNGGRLLLRRLARCVAVSRAVRAVVLCDVDGNDRDRDWI
jgi:hypothetical protein